VKKDDEISLRVRVEVLERGQRWLVIAALFALGGGSPELLKIMLGAFK
jgi:hypothetical protein